jgi:hypothetical protein
MVKTYSTHGSAGKIHIKFWSENLKGKDNLRDTSVDRRIKGILKWI